MENKFIVSSSPHVHTKDSTCKIMWQVILSLFPAAIAAVYIYGVPALKVIILGVLSAVGGEALLQYLTRQKITIYDGSAFLTGLLLAFNLPPKTPFWLPIVGSFFAIAIGKHVFGGLGQNIFNPALVGRVFLMASWPKFMTSFIAPLNYDAVTSATPLALLKEGKGVDISYLNLLVGNRAGCLGEVCIIALLIGALFLLIRGYISWHIPLSYIATTIIFMFLFSGKLLFSGDWLFHLLNGGLILGAFFMATDYVTSPLTRSGQIIFGIGCGLLTAVIRIWGGYPEGVSYAILIMNAVTPFIDRYTRNRIYGTEDRNF